MGRTKVWVRSSQAETKRKRQQKGIGASKLSHRVKSSSLVDNENQLNERLCLSRVKAGLGSAGLG